MLKINSRIIIIRHEYYADKTLGWFWFSKGISAWKMCCECLARNSNIPICICWWNNLRDFRFHGKMCNSSSTRKIYFKLTYWQLLSFIIIARNDMKNHYHVIKHTNSSSINLERIHANSNLFHCMVFFTYWKSSSFSFAWCFSCIRNATLCVSLDGHDCIDWFLH